MHDRQYLSPQLVWTWGRVSGSSGRRSIPRLTVAVLRGFFKFQIAGITFLLCSLSPLLSFFFSSSLSF